MVAMLEDELGNLSEVPSYIGQNALSLGWMDDVVDRTANGAKSVVPTMVPNLMPLWIGILRSDLTHYGSPDIEIDLGEVYANFFDFHDDWH